MVTPKMTNTKGSKIKATTASAALAKQWAMGMELTTKKKTKQPHLTSYNSKILGI